MPGIWNKVTSICASRRTVAYAQCRAWADEGSAQCRQWADQGSYQCGQWADEGSNQCSKWADEGSNQCRQWADQGQNHCCTWWPCSWGCKAFYWVSKWVCVASYWVANWVCQATYWVAKWVCKASYWLAKWVCVAWYWVAKWVCLAWQWIFYVFCVCADGGPMFLLTDGTVLMNECSGGYGTRRWWKLTPDSGGSYTAGLWTRVADSNNARKYFASAVLADGRLLVCGGEYSDAGGGNSQDDTALSEIYDPVADTWTPVAPPHGVSNIGDSPCCVLPDGRFLLGSYNGTSTFLFDPASGHWTPGASKLDSGSEETWVLTANHTVLVPQCSNSPKAEEYVIGNNQWIPAGTLVAPIVEPASIEIGPGLLLADGRAFFVGATGGNTALYTPGTGLWMAGPTIPVSSGQQVLGAKDGPGVLLPSGAVLFPAAPVDGVQGDYLPPCSFFEFAGTSVNGTSAPPNANCPTYVGRMLLLPTGQVLWAREDDSAFYAYTETGTPQNSFRPVVTTAPPVIVAGATVAVHGKQLNGLSQAVSYGDDYAAATNYPLVRIRHLGSGRVRYCRTFDHAIGATPSMGVATGSAIVTTHVAVPGNIDRGPSELAVVANGIPSKEHPVLIP